MSAWLLALLTIETLSFIGLGLYFLVTGQWRLGAAQVLLAVVNLVLYTGKMT